MADRQDSETKPAGKNSGTSLSRREFLETSGATLVAGTVAPAAFGAQASSEPAIDASGRRLTFTVNGIERSVEVQDHWTLVELLRDTLELTGTKIGCNRSECGACTVLVDGEPVYSCSQLAVWMEGRSVTTVEGLAVNGRLSPLQQAFVNHNGPQCGFCTPGQLMSATALLAANPAPAADEVRAALVGNLCRCANYNAIVEAVVDAGRRSGGAA
jgi:aerobic-type carbon monoxide dehydrogenase small subunit (CoxS/CutS family)